jgi:hypothetical protein
MNRYVGPHTATMTIARVWRLVEAGRMDAMPKTETTKLAGKKSMETSVRMRMFWPWVTVVRASRTAEALKSCEGLIKLRRGIGCTHAVS